MRKHYILLTIVIILFFNACATYQAQYKEEVLKSNKSPEKEVESRFYLIGDAGLVDDGEMSNALSAFKKYVSLKDTKNDMVLFLGDNIYPVGLPKKDEADRAEAEKALDVQIDAVKDFEGDVLFIPGNHDWYSNGLKGLKRQEKYIEDALGKNTFQPENGCPIEDIDIGDHIKLIVVDTQWYLENWNDNPTINDKCEIKTRARFFEELEGEIKKAQNKTTIIAMHHPMYTNGVHGGYYGAKKHLYPTQSKIPLPILASLATQIRTQGGVSIQDRYNERYNELMKRIETLTFDKENIVFVSGHEHTLQYLENQNIKQIVSGAGSKDGAAALGTKGLFSYGGQGFAELLVYKDGSSWVKFFSVENDASKLIFEHEIIGVKSPYDVSNLPDTFPNEINASVYKEEETDRTGFFKSVWGDHYREVYNTKIKAKVATLDTLYGGLQMVRRGGGHQTRSLRLETKDGHQLNMRALRKSATQYLQAVLFKENYIEDDFERTQVEDLVLDFYTAAHPYAFLAVPDLSDAAEVYHTNPSLFFIPKHKYLGNYNDDYGGELYMIEERPEESYSGKQTFGFADDIESTHDVIEKVREDEEYKIDENAFIRARLFDMLIGDWDRHQDQWRWAQFNQPNGDKLYRPIPRDRDQVFSNFDGALLDVARVVAGAVKQLQVYDDKLENIKWMNNAGIKLDRTLIQQSGKEEWLEHAKFLQEHITDEVIEKAFSKIPKEVQDETLEDIKKNLKGRRINLVDIATRYYDYLNELVILTGTDKDDYIEVIRQGDKETRVIISRIKGGEKADVIVDKVLNKDVTKELWIYGLDDKDVFEVTGKGSNKIFTRLIGGQENDTYKIKSGSKIKIYDHKSKNNTIEEKSGAAVRLTDIYNLNLFDFNKNILNQRITSPAIGYNPDDGISLGISHVITKNGFQRNPFSSQHRFNGGYFFATEGFSLNYDGEFSNIFGNWNLQVGGQFTSENYTNNFFGYGNETVNLEDDLDRDYNRVKTSITQAYAGISKKGDFGSDYGVKAIFEGIELEATNYRFITDFIPDVNSEFYERQYFGGIEGEFNYKSFDSEINPTRGMKFMLDAGAKTKLKNADNTYGYINADLGFYNALSEDRKLVLKTDVRSQFRIGNDMVFYQAANIGGDTGLRGYRTERFTGKKSFVSSADLRYSFNSFRTSVAPLQIGVFGGFDIGRVWLKNDVSDKWHNDYGGGFWVTAAESLSGTFNLFNGEDGLRFSFGLGFSF